MQRYHSNAATNIRIRCEIHNSHMPAKVLAEKYGISENTVGKWKKREKLYDAISRPHSIHYALTSLEKELVKSVRRTSWLPLDEVTEIIRQIKPTATRSAVYRTLKAANLNKIPQKEQEKAKKFKAYEPGFLHIDVTYLPKIDGKRQYLFVAIDRATRIIFYQIYDAKSADNAQEFVCRCISFFPFKITHILTDNGLEFTNALLISKKGKCCTKPSKVNELCQKEQIEHRLTPPHTPKTNGMVERVNGIIKSNTILKEEYANTKDMEDALARFLVFYTLYRRHGSLKKELGVKTPLEAVEKWYDINPDLFSQHPLQFKEKVLILGQKFKSKHGNFTQQRGET